MKTKALSVLAGVSAPLIVAGAADAGFVGIKVVAKTGGQTPGGVPIFVCNVFATFNRAPSGGIVHDRFLAVAGTPNSPMDIHTVGANSTFFQVAGSGANGTPPSASNVNGNPLLNFDTFVTIGVKKIGNPDFPNYGGQFPAPLTLTPGWPGFVGGFLGGTNLSWAVTPADPNSDAFNPNYISGNGQVLIGQF